MKQREGSTRCLGSISCEGGGGIVSGRGRVCGELRTEKAWESSVVDSISMTSARDRARLTRGVANSSAKDEADILETIVRHCRV